MSGYTAREAARVVGLAPSRLRALVRDGVLSPERGARGELRFSFQDLVLLRTARGLLAAEISPRRVRAALRKLRHQLPTDRPLTGVHISAEGDRIIVRDGRAAWHPESGQVLFDFDAGAILHDALPAAAPTLEARATSGLDADRCYQRGCELEPIDRSAALAAYRRSVEIDPDHADARTNLGRLLHEDGEVEAAVGEYQRALDVRPGHPVAAFNLGVALEDLGRDAAAVAAYEQAIASDPRNADAHYNLALACERLGRSEAAIRHLATYRRLTRGR